MADRYGAAILPAPIPIETGFPPVVAPGDILLGYLADFLKTVMEFHVGDLWENIQPGKPLVKTVYCDGPEFTLNESSLPALFIYRPGRETREIIETFEQIADDYRFQKGRVACQWIMNPQPDNMRRQRDAVVDVLRKAIDASIHIGRHRSWIVPGDTDPTSPTYDSHAANEGSSLLGYTGAAVIELDHAGPGQYIHKMAPPAPIRSYEELKMSFLVEEQDVPDLTLQGEANVQLKATFVSPDQGTGLGPFILGDAIYE